MAVTDLIIGAESGGNPLARNPRSSALGSGQFISSTWLNMVRKHRPDLAGRPDAEILALRTDPELSREMTSRYADDNSAFLRSRGHETTPGNTYLAHFAGPAGAAAILANPGATVEALLGSRAVAANPFLRGKTGADVIEWANRKMTPGQHMAASLRQRYGEGSKPAVAAAPDMDRLKSALSGKSYDQDKLTDAEKLMGRGQEIASTSGNAIGAIGGTILAGLGGYNRGQEQGNKQGHDAALREGLSTSTDPMAAARLMMSSSSPDMQAAGLELFTKLSAAASKEAPPQQYEFTKYGVGNKYTGEVKPYADGKADPELTLEQGKYEQGLRKEYTALTADLRTTNDSFNRMRTASKADTGAGDIAMVYSYMKMLDPTSVVREGEYATAENTGGIPERIWNMYNKALTGARLTPAQRSEFLGAGEAIAKDKGERFQKLRGQFEEIAKMGGADPNRIMLDEGMVQPESQLPTPQAQAPQPGAIEDGYRFKGGDPADPNSWEKVQ